MNVTENSTRPGPLVGGPNPREHKSRRSMTPLRRLIFAIAAPIAVAILRLMWATYRFDLRGDEEVQGVIASGEPLVFTHWHDSIFICAWYLVQLGRRGARVTYLVSPSPDGEFAVRLLAVMGGRAVRGSATRSGVKAMHGLYKAMVRENASPVVVPDGPQGPPHHCKLGSVMLSQLTGAKMLPIGCAARSVWRLRTWDRLQIPRPFTRVAIVVGRPAGVPKEMSENEREAQRKALEDGLEGLVAEAETISGVRPRDVQQEPS